jgi:phage tail sheath gpL-like
MSSNSIISQPEVNISIISAALNVGLTEQKVLFVGQMLSGTATAGTLVQNIGADGEEDALFGSKSHIAGMIRAARKINKATRFDALPLADSGTGVAATGSIAITGAATESTSFNVIVGSEKNYNYTISVTEGDTAATVAAAIESAVDDDDYVPVTASLATATVTFTASNKGTIGNKIGLKIDGTVGGLSFTLTGMTGGANDPSLTTVFDPVDSVRYQTIIWPSTYSKTTVVDFLDDRFNSSNAILDGVAMTQNTDTYANLITALEALNSKSLVFLCNKYVNDDLYKGGSMLEMDDIVSSEFGATDALRLTDDTDISRYVISTYGARDTFGGAALASMAYQNTPFYNLPIVATDKGFTALEISNLTDAGGSVIGNNVANNQVIAGQIATTYKTNSAGVTDPSFKFLEYVRTITTVREYFYNNLKAFYAQTRLTQGDLVPGRSMANEESIEAYLGGLYDELGGVDFDRRFRPSRRRGKCDHVCPNCYTAKRIKRHNANCFRYYTQELIKNEYWYI